MVRMVRCVVKNENCISNFSSNAAVINGSGKWSVQEKSLTMLAMTPIENRAKSS